MGSLNNQQLIFSENAIKTLIEKQYGFNCRSCTPITYALSATYRIDTIDTVYIFKIYLNKHRTMAEVEEEVGLLAILSTKSRSVTSPLFDRSGKAVQNINTTEGLRYAVLFTLAKGVEQLKLSAEQLTTVGREIAIIHKATLGLQLRYERREFTIDVMLAEPVAGLKPVFAEMQNEYNYLCNAAKIVMNAYRKLDLTAFGYGYCHNDLHPLNFHFQEDGRVTIFDFELASKGYFVNDLTSFYSHYYRQIMLGVITRQEAASAYQIFLNSYGEIRPNVYQELSAFPFIGFAIWVYYTYYDYKNFDTPPYPDYFKDQFRWIQLWMEWYVLPVLQK